MTESAIERLIEEHGHPLVCASLGMRADGRYGVADERLCNCKIADARAEYRALLARLQELTPPLGSSAAFCLLSAGDPEC